MVRPSGKTEIEQVEEGELEVDVLVDRLLAVSGVGLAVVVYESFESGDARVTELRPVREAQARVVATGLHGASRESPSSRLAYIIEAPA